jgi:hypothetical protein
MPGRDRDFFGPRVGPTQSPMRYVLGAISPRIKILGRGGECQPPPSSEFKDAWSYTSIPPRLYDTPFNYAQGQFHLSRLTRLNRS